MQNLERRIVALEVDRAFGSIYEAPTSVLEEILFDHFGHEPSDEELQFLARG
jgi:hypothetical protein